MNDLLEVELRLYGSRSGNLSVRRFPGGEERWNDVAQAWIEGNREAGLAYARVHEENVRRRGNTVNDSRDDKVIGSGNQDKKWKHNRGGGRRKLNEQRLRELWTQGMKQRDIAAALGLSLRHVARTLSTLSLRRYRKRQSETGLPESATITSPS